MIIGVPTEIKTREYRVGINPGGVLALSRAGHEVRIQKGAGLGAGISLSAPAIVLSVVLGWPYHLTLVLMGEGMVRDAHDRLRERLAAIDATAASMQQAAENLRIRQAQFDEGRATSEDLLEASQLLTHQRALHATALYQAHARWAELQQLAGWSLEGEPGEAGGPSGADHGATR